MKTDAACDIGRTARGEEGFVLILTLVTLLLLTLFGVWALTSSDFENRVAGNVQRAERIFNVNEGANYSEASKILHSRRGWFVITNPNDLYKVMLPEKEKDFDPFAGGMSAYGLTRVSKMDPDDIKENPEYWLWENLEGDYGARRDTSSDYRYLVTYLYPDTMKQGSSAEEFASYKFRIQASAANQSGVIEAAGSTFGYK